MIKYCILVILLSSCCLFADSVDQKTFNTELGILKLKKKLNLKPTGNPRKDEESNNVLFYSVSNKNYAYLILQNGCDGGSKLDYGKLYAGLFELNNKKWKLKAIANDKIFCSSYCGKCEVNLMQIGHSNYGLVIEKFEEFQGSAPATLQFSYIYSRVNKEVKKIFNFVNYYMDGNGGAQYSPPADDRTIFSSHISMSVKSKFESIKDQAENFWNLKLIFHGQDYFKGNFFNGNLNGYTFKPHENGYIRKFEYTNTYKFHIDRYELVGQQSSFEKPYPISQIDYDYSRKDKLFQISIEQNGKSNLLTGIFSDIQLERKSFNLKFTHKKNIKIKVYSMKSLPILNLFVEDNQDFLLSWIWQDKVEKMKKESKSLAFQGDFESEIPG